MDLNDRQYERVGRFLAGETVELTDAERAAAEDLRRGEAEFSTALQVSPDQAVLDLALQKAMRTLNERRRRHILFLRPVAAAAAIILAVAGWHFMTQADRSVAIVVEPLPVAEVADVYALGESDMDLDLIATELADLSSEVLMQHETDRIETEMDDLQHRVSSFWLEAADEWPDEI